MMLKGIELSAVSLAIFLWYKGSFTPGGLIIVIFYMGQLWGRLHDIGRNMRDYLRAESHCQEMIDIINEPLGITDKEDAPALQIQQGGIEIRNVTFHYDQYHEALFENFSLSIRPNERLALVGHSGSGKTTLTKLILRLYDIGAGSILIDGQNIAEVTQESLRQAMSLVPQEPILFHRTIAENISYARHDATTEEIERAAKLAHAHEFIAKLPQEYDTLVGERGIKLSGGERQRVAIARAILADKPILILDEATSSLDSVSEQYIQNALEHLIKDRTAIIIAHRLSTVRSCDRIAVLDNGTLVAFGPHEELMANCATYKEMVDLQSQGMLAE